MKVLNIEVDDALLAKWRAWYAPEVQPYFVDSVRGLPKSLGGAFTLEFTDTFRTYSPKHRGKKVVWYDDATAREAGFTPHVADNVVTWVAEMGEVGHHPHANAPTFAGTFPASSGPNCFGAAMGLHNERVVLEPFEDWLRTTARRGGRDEEPGTLLVWRDTTTRDPFHAAVTVGDGFAFEKSSQAWYSPYYVAPVAEIKRLTRMKGIRLERWRITGA